MFHENSVSDSCLHCHRGPWGEYSIEYWTSNLEIDPGPELEGTSLLHPASGAPPICCAEPLAGLESQPQSHVLAFSRGGFQGFTTKSHINPWMFWLRAKSCTGPHVKCFLHCALCNRLALLFPATRFLPLGAGLLGKDQERPSSTETYIWEVHMYN